MSHATRSGRLSSLGGLMAAALLAALTLCACAPSSAAPTSEDLLFPKSIGDYTQISAADAYTLADKAGATSAGSESKYRTEVGKEFTSMLDRNPNVTVDRVQFYRDSQQHLFVVVKATSPTLNAHGVRQAAARVMNLPESETNGDVIAGKSMLVAFVNGGWVSAASHLPTDPSPIAAYRSNVEEVIAKPGAPKAQSSAEFLRGDWACDVPASDGRDATKFTANFDGKKLTFGGENPPGVYSPTLNGPGAVVTRADGGFVSLDTGWTLFLPEAASGDHTVRIPIEQFEEDGPSSSFLGAPHDSESYLTVVKSGTRIHVTMTNLNNDAEGSTATWDLGECSKR